MPNLLASARRNPCALSRHAGARDACRNKAERASSWIMSANWTKPLGAAIDRGFRELLINKPPRRRDKRSVEERVDELDREIERLARPEFISEPSSFFRTYTIDEVRERRARSRVPGVARDMSWHSAFDAHFEENQAVFAKLRRNSWARMRLIQRDPARPRQTLILIHGFLGGNPLIEELLFPALALYEAGYDLALVTLPGHGARREGGTLSRPSWPARGPSFTIDGYRQAIADLRAIVDYLLRLGAPSVGGIGMSLGGYTLSLLATVEERLSFAIPYIPLASHADYLLENGLLGEDPKEVKMLHERLERLFSAVSPLSRPPLVPRSGRAIIVGEADAITPPSHGERIAAHWGISPYYFGGAHLLQLGRTEAMLGALNHSTFALSGAFA